MSRIMLITQTLRRSTISGYARVDWEAGGGKGAGASLQSRAEKDARQYSLLRACCSQAPK